MKVRLDVKMLPMLADAIRRKSLEMEFKGTTVGDLIQGLCERYGRKARNVFFPNNRGFDVTIQILRNEKEWIRSDRHDTALEEGDKITFLLFLAGG